jgi:hypothetical protein
VSVLLAASVLLGVVFIATRGPLFFAPAKTLQFYRSRPKVVRMFAAFVGALGVAMFLSAQNVEGTFPSVAYYLGIGTVLATILLMIAPGFPIRVLDKVGTPVLRARGLMSVIGGVVWIYYCFAYLY